MADLTYPVGFPRPLLEGLNGGPLPNTVRSSVDVGVDRVRQRSTAAVEVYPITTVITKEQRTTLHSFWLNDTKSGQKRFEWYHPFTDQLCEMRFRSEPQYSFVSNTHVKATFTVECLP